MKRLFATIIVSLLAMVSLADNIWYLKASDYWRLKTDGYWAFGAGVVPPVATDLVLEYLMGTNGNESTITLDTSGNSLTGTVNNCTFNIATNGASDNYTFNGTTSFIDATYTNLNLTEKITISAWFKSSVSGIQYILGKDDVTNRDYGLAKKLDNTILFYVFSGGAFKDVSSDSTYDDGLWHQAVGVMDGTNVLLYIDSVLQTQTETASSIDNDGASVYVGARSDNDEEWNGQLDEIYVYDIGLSQSVISTNYINEANTLGLVSDYLAANTNIYWNDTALYVGFNNIIQDGSPNNLTLTTTSAPDLKGTTSEGWGDFDGSANRVVVGGSDSWTSTNYTFMVWFDSDRSSSAFFDSIFNRNQGGNIQGDCALIWMNDNKMRFYVQDGSTTKDISSDSTYTTPNEWHHMAVVGNSVSNTLLLYMDGVLQADQETFLKLYPHINSVVGEIGRQPGGTTEWDGNIDEFYFIDRSLTSNEVYNYYLSTTNTHSN